MGRAGETKKPLRCHENTEGAYIHQYLRISESLIKGKKRQHNPLEVAHQPVRNPGTEQRERLHP
jgi:hypothetical protein